MAFRARLAAPQPQPREEWPWHQPKWASLASHLLWRGDRRMEAENYLSNGYGLRLAIQSRAAGWQRLGQLARIWQPSRLKGIQVGPDFGIPFLAATQVFDIRPMPRKWLSLEQTHDAEDRFVAPGTIVITCSGAVGRATLAHAPHERTLISHDLLRVTPENGAQWGWLYAYLRSPQALAMMRGAQYGHIIKHLEISHLDALPVPVVSTQNGRRFQAQVTEILDLRNRSYARTTEAYDSYAQAVGLVRSGASDAGFSVRASALSATRRRLEASYYAPWPLAILNRFRQMKARIEVLSDIADRVWWMARFKRFYGDAGIPYISADELFSLNSTERKRILVDPQDKHRDYFVRRGWIVMACSGQVYGLNGSAALMTEHDENIFFSHDLIRIISKPNKIRPGYLLVTLTHPQLGRPLVIRAAYGTSIPHLDPGDVSKFPVVRLSGGKEAVIADLAEEAASLRARADAMERELASRAGTLVDQFVAGEMKDFITTSLPDQRSRS